tara:strand:- start:646 stop:1416 length:771 start_codon:yes stop_codon:yes gene_type:complete
MNENSIVFITGSSKGIGRGVAQYLLSKDYKVIINGRNKSSLNETFNELSKNSKNNLFKVQGDVSKENDVIQIKEFIEHRFGGINHLICNVGSGRSKVGLSESMNEFKEMFDINFFNAVLVSKTLIPLIKNNNSNNKTITFISSIAGIEYINCPISYSCAKASLNVFSKSLSKTLGSDHIRVNTISPGNILFDGSTWDKKITENKKETESYISKNVPLNMFGSPLDIGRVVHHIISEKSSFLTGSNYVLDGGQNNKF